MRSKSQADTTSADKASADKASAGRASLLPTLFLPTFFLPTVLVAAGEATTATDLNNQAVLEGRAGRVEEGVALLRQALALAPNDPEIRRNLSSALTDWARTLQAQGPVDRPIALLEEAVQLEPRNGPAWVSLGDLSYFHQSDFDQAIRCWRQARGALTDAQWQPVAERLSQAERDQAVERQFATHETPHFRVRFAAAPLDQGGLTGRGLAARVGERLEEAYARLQEALGVNPSALTVILYPPGDLQRLSKRREWGIGFYDGRIRIRQQDLGTNQEARILAHELAHAFLHRAYGPRLPIWVHEGYAQVSEPPRPLFEEQSRWWAMTIGVSMPPRSQTQTFVHAGRSRSDRHKTGAGLVDQTHWVPLQWLDSRFQQPVGSDELERAYRQARMVVAFLINRHGQARFTDFLQRLSKSEAVDAAYEAAFAPSRWSRVAAGHLE